MRPTVGQMVHYFPHGAPLECPRSAVVTCVWTDRDNWPDNRVDLFVFPVPTDSRHFDPVQAGIPCTMIDPSTGLATNNGSHWSWPPRN